MDESSPLCVPTIHPSRQNTPEDLESVGDAPILLPHILDQLAGPAGEHHIIIEEDRLHLAAWKVSGQASVRENFQKRLSASLRPPGDQALRSRTIALRGNGVASVTKGKFVPFQLL